MNFHNPLQGKALNFPKEYKDKVETYCATKPGGGESEGPEYNPFKRQVDLWFTSFCLGVNSGNRTKSKNVYRFITGEVLAQNNHMIEIIEMVAIAETKEPLIVGDTQKLADISNEYAATGIAILFNALKYTKDQTPLWNLVEYFKDNL